MSTAFQSNAFQGNAFQIGAPQTGPADVSVYGWRQALSEPVRRKILPVACIAASGWVGPQIPTVSFSWFEGLSEPVRTAPRLVTGAQQFTAGDTDPIVSFSWFKDLSEPVRAKPRLLEANQRFFEFNPYPITPSTGWYAALSEPVRAKARLIEGAQQALAWTPITITPAFDYISWFNALSEPVRRLPRLLEGQQRFFEFNPQPITPSTGWYAALSEPVRTRTLPTSAQQFFTTDPLPRVSFSWFNELSRPPGAKSGLAAWLQQAEAWTPINIAQTVDYGWFSALSEPVRTKRFPTAAQQFFTASPLPFTPSIGWHQALSEPQRRKPALITGAQQFTTRSTQPFVSFGWNRPDTNLPPRAKPGLRPDLQMAFTMPPRLLTPSMGWFEAWTDRQAAPPKGLGAWLQQASAWTPINIFTPGITGIWASTETGDAFLARGSMFEAPLEAIVGVIEVAFQGLSSVVESRDTGGISGLPTEPAAGSGGTAVPTIASANVAIRVI